MQLLVALFVSTLVHILLLAFFRRRYEADLFRVVSLTYVGTVALRYTLAIYL